MEKNFKQHIGLERSFDQRGFILSLSAFNKLIKPIAVLSQVYESLNVGAFDQGSFTLLMSDKGLKSISSDYEAAVKEDLKKLNLTTAIIKTQALNSIQESIEKLKAARDAVNKAYQEAQNNADKVYIKWEYISIVDGLPVIDEEQIKKEAIRSITSDLQAEWYQHLINIKESYEACVAFAKTHNVSLPRDIWDQVFIKEGSIPIAVAPAAPFLIDAMLNFKKMQDESIKRQQERADKDRAIRESMQLSITRDLTTGKEFSKPEPAEIEDHSSL